MLLMYTTQKRLRILNILDYLCTSYMLCVHIAYINYTKKLRIFNILNYFWVVYVKEYQTVDYYIANYSLLYAGSLFW